MTGCAHANASSNSHGARPVHLIITMIQWIRTSRLSIKNSLSLRKPGPCHALDVGGRAVLSSVVHGKERNTHKHPLGVPVLNRQQLSVMNCMSTFDTDSMFSWPTDAKATRSTRDRKALFRSDGHAGKHVPHSTRRCTCSTNTLTLCNQ